MIKNYFKIALRNLVKNRIFSFVNIIGLALGIAATILLTFYVRHERSYENVHENADDIFRLSLNLYNGNEFIINDVETYQTLGPAFKESMSEVLDYVRLANMDAAQIKANNKVFYEQLIYAADPSVFKIFSYEVIEGDPYSAFNEPYKATISRDLAIKYFGRTDVIGETFQYSLTKEPIEIVGVTENSPQNTHLKFDILLSHETLPLYWTWYLENAWGGNNEYTYLLMEPGTSVSAFNEKLAQYSEDSEHIEDEVVISESINDIHLYSNKSFEPEVNGNAQTVDFMVLIAIFIILLAWINYVNLSTSRAVNRAKEVGIRKVVGSSRNQLIRQFLMESLMVNIIACILAFTIVQISIPAFADLTGQTLPQNLFADSFILFLFGGIVVVGTLLSGIYPAFVLSSFAPVMVLKGRFANSSKGYFLRKGLVVFQFISTVVLIAVSIAVYYQIDFLQNKDLGVDIDNTLVIRRPRVQMEDSIYTIVTKSFADELKAMSIVNSVAQSDALPGAKAHEMGTTNSLKRAGADVNSGSYNYYIYFFNEDFIQTFDIALLTGENFKVNQEDRSRVIINARAVETLGFESAEDAIGQFISYGGGDYQEQVIGVIDNFHQRSPKESYLPMVFRYTPWGDYLSIKLNTKDSKLAIEEVQKVWDAKFADAAFDYYFLDDKYNYQYQTDLVFSSVVVLFTLLSVVIAVLGLVGLSTFTISQRTKEIGVRKVLGASVAGLVALLSKEFLKLVIIAGVLAIPLAYFLIDLWLNNYTSRVEIGWWLYILPIMAIIFIAMVSVIGQTLKSTMANPTDSLRNE
ncbi:ABC transporter permease [Fulvivirga lutimaris]|uniref:ABC transporter permease n=1 Tax=Fulvivirga lutimaris TaxID=1819566 RepID=UPI0012BC253E|nr:FtsX-like permease family protein [Fulvivirga lutimaris]MTI39387.1 FtsX-like permease family protein [Fulvivirga lutimaris]